MCGICGWIEIDHRANAHGSRPSLKTMSTAILHRGPDDWGEAEFATAGIAMTRLSIIDLNSGHQPISNERQDCWIVFNGEIYNFAELRKELGDKGHAFRTRSDTEVILRAYEEWGDDCLTRLRGMFALAIVDLRAQANHEDEPPTQSTRLLLARDRVGKKPLYYYRDEARLIFGSEIKAILAEPSVKAQPNVRALPPYLTYGYVPAPETFFKNTFELPPGHKLVAKSGEVTVTRYWQIPPHTALHRRSSEKEYAGRLRELLKEAVKIRLVSDVPLGAFLSGGVDSAAIVGLMTQIMKEPVKTFAVGFVDEPSFNELEHARRVADLFKSEHREFMVTPDAIRLLPSLVWHYDQPFADSSAIPSFLVAQKTREHVKVALTGDGGDELFAGYERFTAARLAEIYGQTPKLLRECVSRTLKLFPEPTTYRSFIRRARRFVGSAALPLPERYLHWVGIFSPTLIRDLLIDDAAFDPVAHFREYFQAQTDSDLIGQLLAVNMESYLPGDLLVKTDRMTMANSLEARCPFLDHQLLEFACTVPSEFKLKGTTTKYILKEALKDLLPEQVIHRRKHGFGVPVGRWFRTTLRTFLEETLLSQESLQRGYFDQSVLRRLIAEHQAGKRDHGHRLWALLTLEIWHRLFIDKEKLHWRAQATNAESKFCASLGA